MSIVRTAELAGCSIAQVKRVTALHRANSGGLPTKKVSSEDEFSSKFVLSTTPE